MADMKRTTGGLLQGGQRTVTRGDLKSAVDFLEARVKGNEPLRRALGLDIAKRYVSEPLQRRHVAHFGQMVSEVEDLQRAPMKR